MNKLPKIAILSTGGTILSKINTQSGVVKPALTGEELLGTVNGLSSHFEILPIEFLNKPGSDLTMADGFSIACEINKLNKDKSIDGIVVLQGTDTMDEIPYLVDLLVDTDTPVVFTGAMKSMHDFYSDASGNVLGACMVATCEQSKNKGVLVYFNETIFASSELIKAHSSRIDAFSATFGPLGMIINGQVLFVRNIKTVETYNIDKIDAFVPLFKVYSSIENDLVDLAIENGAKGIVIEGFGSGNIPCTMMPVIEKAIAKNIPVVVSTRCMSGSSYACYGYIGGGAMLEQLGVILAGGLSGVKSRIELIVLLCAGKSTDEIREIFKNK